MSGIPICRQTILEGAWGQHPFWTEKVAAAKTTSKKSLEEVSQRQLIFRLIRKYTPPENLLPAGFSPEFEGLVRRMVDPNPKTRIPIGEVAAIAEALQQRPEASPCRVIYEPHLLFIVSINLHRLAGQKLGWTGWGSSKIKFAQDWFPSCISQCIHHTFLNIAMPWTFMDSYLSGPIC